MIEDQVRVELAKAEKRIVDAQRQALGGFLYYAVAQLALWTMAFNSFDHEREHWVIAARSCVVVVAACALGLVFTQRRKQLRSILRPRRELCSVMRRKLAEEEPPSNWQSFLESFELLRKLDQIHEKSNRHWVFVWLWSGLWIMTSFTHFHHRTSSMALAGVLSVAVVGSGVAALWAIWELVPGRRP